VGAIYPVEVSRLWRDKSLTGDRRDRADAIAYHCVTALGNGDPGGGRENPCRRRVAARFTAGARRFTAPSPGDGFSAEGRAFRAGVLELVDPLRRHHGALHGHPTRRRSHLGQGVPPRCAGDPATVYRHVALAVADAKRRPDLEAGHAPRHRFPLRIEDVDRHARERRADWHRPVRDRRAGLEPAAVDGRLGDAVGVDEAGARRGDAAQGLKFTAVPGVRTDDQEPQCRQIL